MKKSIIITIAVLGIIFLTTMFINHSYAQSSQNKGIVSLPISPDVMRIAERSCVKCHTEGGNGMARMHLNLSNWDKLSPEKQADKAKDMCKMVSKRKMPPEGFMGKKSGAAPTQEEMTIICEWSKSTQIIKEEKPVNPIYGNIFIKE
jgi:hypothetical protein